MYIGNRLCQPVDILQILSVTYLFYQLVYHTLRIAIGHSYIKEFCPFQAILIFNINRHETWCPNKFWWKLGIPPQIYLLTFLLPACVLNIIRLSVPYIRPLVTCYYIIHIYPLYLFKREDASILEHNIDITKPLFMSMHVGWTFPRNTTYFTISRWKFINLKACM